jgi:hypothetical protein
MPAPLSFGPTDGWSGVDNLVKFISIVCLQLGPSSNVELSCYKTRWRHALGPFLGSAMHVFSFKCFLVNEVATDWYSLVMSYGHDILLGTQLVNKLIQQSIPVATGYQAEHQPPWIKLLWGDPCKRGLIRRACADQDTSYNH